MLPLLFAVALTQAQAPPSQASFLRGVLLERDAPGDSGEFSVRGPQSEVVRYRFDAKTLVVLGDRTGSIAQLHPGEEVEVQSDPIAESPLRRALFVHAVALPAPPRPTSRPRTPTSSLPPETMFPRGDLTYSGVVSFLSDGRLVLRTRDAGEQTILLRRDTRYLAGGDIARGSDLKANMRVFVRAGKDLYGHTEAYQVMWGRFLEPQNP
jgi:hypothetical protein